MTALADLQEQRKALVEARSTGARRVKFQTHEAEFHSVRELDAIIASIDREIAALQGRRVHTFLPHFSKGL